MKRKTKTVLIILAALVVLSLYTGRDTLVKYNNKYWLCQYETTITDYPNYQSSDGLLTHVNTNTYPKVWQMWEEKKDNPNIGTYFNLCSNTPVNFRANQTTYPCAVNLDGTLGLYKIVLPSTTSNYQKLKNGYTYHSAIYKCDQSYAQPFTCTDSDGGNAPATWGMVDSTPVDQAAGGVTLLDSCRDTHVLLERVCMSDGTAGTSEVDCSTTGKICKDGECVTPPVTCTTPCTQEGLTQCTTDKASLQTCTKLSSGCLNWQTTTCGTGNTCTGTTHPYQCAPIVVPPTTCTPACTTGYTCNATTLTCQAVPPTTCSPTCVAPQTCDATTKTCKDPTICPTGTTLTCSDTGCTCTSGTCQTVCVDGDTKQSADGEDCTCDLTQTCPTWKCGTTTASKGFIATINGWFKWPADSKNGLYVLLGAGALLLLLVMMPPQKAPVR